MDGTARRAVRKVRVRGHRNPPSSAPARLAVGFGPKEISPTPASVRWRFTPRTWRAPGGFPAPRRHPGARRLSGILLSVFRYTPANGRCQRVPRTPKLASRASSWPNDLPHMPKVTNNWFLSVLVRTRNLTEKSMGRVRGRAERRVARREGRSHPRFGRRPQLRPPRHAAVRARDGRPPRPPGGAPADVPPRGLAERVRYGSCGAPFSVGLASISVASAGCAACSGW